MNAELLADLDLEIKARHRDINACLVVNNGYLAFEKYYGGFGPGYKHLVASVTKSFISALIGIAIDKGFIEGVDQPVLGFFPEYESAAGDHLKGQLTIKHLLTMTSGFQWRTGARLHELYVDRLRRNKDWVSFILSLPVREKSVDTFQYNSANSHLLSAIITQSTGMYARDFATKHLFEPIGMTPPAPNTAHTYSQADVFRNTSGIWPTDPQGNNIGGWGLYLSPRDMARFGYLYLNKGQWDNEQIVPESWVVDSISPYTPGYGYQWWLRDVNGVFVFSADGQGGNHIYCLPGKDIVMVVASRPSSRWRDRSLLLKQFLVPAAKR
jgi:CubicO group peptidase (beta-lactamase class C family)